MKRISILIFPVLLVSFIMAAIITFTGMYSLEAFAADGKTQALTTNTSKTEVSKVSGKWEKWKSGWYFKKKDGQYATGFIQPNAEKHVYYLNNKGLMKIGWVKVGEKWYYANSSGALASGWKKLSGKWYYLDPKDPAHAAVTGFFSDGTAKYYTHPTGCQMLTGWIKVGGKWYFANNSGALFSGWKEYKGGWYYLDPTDEWFVMRTGLFQPNNSKYRFYADSNGKVVTNKWVKNKGEYFFANDKGELHSFPNIRIEGDKAFLTDKDGKPIEGWHEEGGAHFYGLPGKNGQLATGWLQLGGAWYYFDKSGAMATGWRSWNGGWYYLSPKDGKMYTKGWKSIDGVQYKFASSGKMVGAWMDVPCYYQNPELPTGCESVALTNALRYYGFKLSKTTIADSYLPRSGSNFVTAFTGNPYSGSGGQTCAPGIEKAANKYLKNQGSSLRAHEITGTSFSKLCTQHIANGRPVIIWASIGYSYAGSVYAVQSYNGRTYSAFSLSHTMVLCGYDDEQGVVWLSDSISGKVKLSYGTVKGLYNKHGAQSVIIN